MMISTQHLFPVLAPPVTLEPPPQATPVAQTPAGEGQSLAVTPQPGGSGECCFLYLPFSQMKTAPTASETAPVTPTPEESADGSKDPKDEDVEMADGTTSSEKATKDGKGEKGEVDSEKTDGDNDAKVKDEDAEDTLEKGKDKEADSEKTPAKALPVEVIDVDELDSKPAASTAATQVAPTLAAPVPLTYGAFNIDVSFEASKLPLDVAIFNSARAAGGDEKIRKYLQAVLVIGGTALVPGMSHALESRYGSG